MITDYSNFSDVGSDVACDGGSKATAPEFLTNKFKELIMRFNKILLATLALMSVALWMPQAQAIPGFARQTGMACSGCHFQHYPMLNAYGRAFKAGGYTQMGGDAKLVEGEDISIPVTANPGLFTKIRYQKTNGYNKGAKADGTNTNKGELQLPDEAVFLLGGHAGEHIGFFLEASLNEGLNPAVTVFSNFRMPIVYDAGSAKLNIIPFTTAEGGASFGFESLNTGAGRMIKPFEQRGDYSAQQYIGTASLAEGVAFVAVNDMGYINYSLWRPGHAGYAGTDAEAAGPVGKAVGHLSNYLRIAATPNIGGFDTGFGVQYWGGTTDFGNTITDTNQKFSTDAWAVDAQVQGNAGSMLLGVYLSYGTAAASKDVKNGLANGTTETSLFNENAKDKTAWAILSELGVLPGRATVALGYRAGNTGAAANNGQNAIFLGATYLLAQNVKLEINHSMYSGSYYSLASNNQNADGNRLTTLMLAAGF